MVSPAKASKNAGIAQLLGNIRPSATPAPTVPAPISSAPPKASPRMIIQEAKTVKKTGRPSSASTAGVESIKVSPTIPLTLKRKVDRALAEELAAEFPTFNDFTAAAFRLLLEARKQPTDLNR